MKILALSGSLRAASTNSALLRATAQLAPAGMDVTVFSGIGGLPLFNPDLELELPPQVITLRTDVAAADALLIASPEYAHGITGGIKNALDWLVSFEPFANKPVAVINASPRAHHADAALRETLKTMSAVIVEAASISIPLLGAGLTEADMVASPMVSSAIKSALSALNEGQSLPQCRSSSAMSRTSHICLMAAYNEWMNTKLIEAVKNLPTEELSADKKAFFGSILGSLNHLVVADIIWLKRFATHPANFAALAPIKNLPPPKSLDQLIFTDLQNLEERRKLLDKIVLAWAHTIAETDLDSILNYTNTKGIVANKNFFSLLMHFFNHQTHHRGQLTTLLSQSGIDIGVTDLLALIPDESTD